MSNKHEKKKKKNKSFYSGRFLPRLIVLVILVIGLTTVLVYGLIRAVIAINNRLANVGEISPYLMLFIITLGAMFLGTIITLIGSGMFLSPIKSLEKGMDKVAKGDFSVNLEGDSVTQIGKLMNNFNKMAHDLSQIETFKNEFISNVSHEFKTPLSVIQGYAMLLQNEELTNEERQAYLSIIIESAQTLSNMTSNILRLSKLENSEIVVDISEIDVSEQIRRCTLSLESAWSEKQLNMIVDLQDDLFVMANEDLLFQVWTNLLSNAIKFTDEGGEIRITSEKESNEVAVRVSDNGLGMSEEILPKIFDKFYQGDNSHSKEGNGLGLALTKKIIDVSGGRITAESVEGEGSTFTVFLPISNKKKTESKLEA